MQALDSVYSDFDVACNHSFTYQIQAILSNGEISFSDSITVKSFDTIRPINEANFCSWQTVIKTSISNGSILIIVMEYNQKGQADIAPT